MKAIVCLLFLIASVYCRGQVVYKDTPCVMVNSTGIIKVKPDYAEIVVSVEKEISYNEITSISDAFLFSKVEMNLKVISDNVEETVPQVEIGENQSTFIKKYVIRVNALSNVQKVLIELFKRGFTNIESVRYKVSNLEEVKKEAFSKAIKQAKEKAALLANELGIILGPVYKVEEERVEPFDWYVLDESNDTSGYFSNSYINEPGFIEVVASYKISFSIK